MKWSKLIEVYGRLNAELIESYLQAHGIQTALFQEAVGHHVYPTTVDGLAQVQIFVPNEDLEEACILLNAFEQTPNHYKEIL